MRIVFDNAPTSSRCSVRRCGVRARWWVSNRGRTRNLCDTHMGVALREIAMLEKLTIESREPTFQVEVTGA